MSPFLFRLYKIINNAKCIAIALHFTIIKGDRGNHYE